jgi:hypothetical protein
MAGLLGTTLLLVPIDGLSSGTFGMSTAFFFGRPRFFLMGVRASFYFEQVNLHVKQ